MAGTFWLLPLIVIGMCVLMALSRVVGTYGPDNPDRFRCIVLVGTAAVAGFSLGSLLAGLEASAGDSKPLDFYMRHWAEWPFIVVHIWFAIISLAMGVWLTFRLGAELVARYSTVFLTQPIDVKMATRIGWVLLCYQSCISPRFTLSAVEASSAWVG
jgi:hypothetical protein